VAAQKAAELPLRPAPGRHGPSGRRKLLQHKGLDSWPARTGRTSAMHEVMSHATRCTSDAAGDNRRGTSILDGSPPESVPNRIGEKWDAPANTHTQQGSGRRWAPARQPRGGSRPDRRKPLGPHSSAHPSRLPARRSVEPKRIGFFESGGKGVHRIVWEGRAVRQMSGAQGFTDRIYWRRSIL